MSKSGGKRSGRPRVDTEDRIMESAGRAATWIQNNRRAATLGLIAVVAAVAAGVIYMRYQVELKRQAAVRLAEIQLASRGATPAQRRQELNAYIRQFASTPEADQARLLLAELELRADSVESAIRHLQAAVDLEEGGPLGYNAGRMLAVAEEQRGDYEAAARWYERLIEAARHDFQRREARASLARLHVYMGDYEAAEEIYADLLATAAENDVAGGDGAFYAVRLGEVRARAEAGLPAPTLPAAATAPDTASEAGAQPASDTNSVAADGDGTDTADGADSGDPVD